jgi:hypothetical protein
MPNIASIMPDTTAIFSLVTLLLAAIGAGLLVGALVAARTPGKSNHWPSTTGQILTSMIQYRRKSGGGHSPYSVVIYTYQVASQPYQSQRIYFGVPVGGSAMTGVIKKYPMGAQVPVYYNPENPAEAVLERTIPAAKMLGFAGVIMIAVAAATYFMPKLFGL